MSFYYVKNYYGPCRSLNDVIYTPRKLNGIRVALQKYGYRVDFVPVKWRDYCMLELCGHEVFRCNIQNLKFNTCVERDPVAKRAVQAVLDATVRTLRARCFLWNCGLLDHHIFLKNEYTPKEYFLPTIDIEPLEDLKLNIKRYEKPVKELKAINEEKSVNDDSSDDNEPLSLLPAQMASLNEDDDEDSSVSTLSSDYNDEVNDDICSFEYN